ncbi:MAG: hypothetical protein U5R31_04175 [Acidimicrobiia bacterium]|nr:hypothetical protein [Acidimicrobiia bacterium]
MSDFGMTLRLTIARAQYVKRLVQPTRMGRTLPVLYGWPPGEKGQRPIDDVDRVEEQGLVDPGPPGDTG